MVTLKQNIEQIRSLYISLIATNLRDKMVQRFFGDLSNIMFEFLPELHEVEDVNIKDIYLQYEPSFDNRLFDLKDIQVNDEMLRELDREFQMSQHNQ
ncbi:hypothetical protein RFI_13853 [Reticulomyxa filosa]|uniref:Uncharacterized protein n=1 Tax=Reticulomyxa filosa TaxID=46433 RepID=X6NC17_RETFI|nr:hypothetical protein RFI_13853 [Reticulomyxa filosa]|eukprot:ETO23329.1 hypothetical protein RFI_13853 [Reticulomyxa filosa]